MAFQAVRDSRDGLAGHPTTGEDGLEGHPTTGEDGLEGHPTQHLTIPFERRPV